MKFHNTQLANGLDVIAELNPDVHSVACAFIVRTGARDETPEISGVSHFLEHMVFKGNDRYSADDVNRVLDEIGAKYNASTSEEITLFYAAVLPEYLRHAFELLSSILYPALRESDFDVEKKVILEEIGMYDDMPSFVAFDHAMRLHFAGHPLGKSILGSTESISALRAQQMRDYHARQYRTGNITVVVAGNTSWQQILNLSNEYCSRWPTGSSTRLTDPPQLKTQSECIVRSASQQQHVIQFAAAPGSTSKLRFAADILGVVVGDDSGSRMYWDLVDPGHADAADLAFNDYEGCGTWLTYLNGAPESTASNLERIADIFRRVNREGITQAELDTARNKVASRIVLRSERPMGRLSSLGSNWVYRKEYRSVEDDLKTLNSLTLGEIRTLLDQFPLAQTTTVGVGPLEKLPTSA